MTTIFVSDTSGNDSFDGAEARPVKTLLRGIARLDPSDGGTIRILDSNTYNPGETLSGLNNTQSRCFVSRSIDFVAAEGQTPTITGAGARASSTGPAFSGANAGAGTVVTFQGITFANFNGSGNEICTTNTVSNGNPTIQFTDCTFQQMTSVNIFNDPGRATADIPNLLNRCEVKATCADTIIVNNGGDDQHVLFKNSIFHNTASSTSNNYIDDSSGNDHNLIVRNCTILVDRTTSTTVVRAGVVENTIIKNINAGSVNVGLTGIDADLSYSNNCVAGTFGTDNGAIKDNTGAGATDGGGEIIADPQFVDESSFPEGLQLQEGSPCIDTGKTIASVTVDFNGTSRPQGNAYDMGAFEFIPIPYWQDDDNGEDFSRKFGGSFTIHSTANKLFTRAFPRSESNRQAPYYVTIPGPANIRGKTPDGKPYKAET